MGTGKRRFLFSIETFFQSCNTGVKLGSYNTLSVYSFYYRALACKSLLTVDTNVNRKTVLNFYRDFFFLSYDTGLQLGSYNRL